ncbi:TetR/AcrR family transcriptional regulator [Marinilongibacter aquaticus]|uniref:TetR/AcrR family transcriptional regulator n=1 Tax=Marinilongibacter aquaticus TaxID=2975157 RepID=UPI0021BDA950|nr:TetR/AcrR family transcriptional regulator [Marinilongibacter aquaticus]UBM60895.1 TetR/AcrR family transcriptional regulator [Marinilongibacter aquaticus]
MVEATNTEEKILLAAEKVFISSGYDGARMQEIADEAGINKAMLHYYFRSKDLLFARIFDEKAKYFFPEVKTLLESGKPFLQIMKDFVKVYIHFALGNPYIPIFIISTVNTESKRDFIDRLPFKNMVIDKLLLAYQEAYAKGQVCKIEQPLQFLLSVVGMCVFPFLARPILHHGLHIEADEFEQMMLLRIGEVQGYIEKILKV